MNKAAIVYISSNGTTEATVNKINNKNVDVIDLKKEESCDISDYDKILIGFGIYAGAMPRKMISFLKEKSSQLTSKEVIFFVHGLDGENNYQEIIKTSFPQVDDIRKKSYYYLGGYVDLKKQNIFIKQMLKVIAKKKEIDPNNMNNLDENKIKEFVDSVNKI